MDPESKSYPKHMLEVRKDCVSVPLDGLASLYTVKEINVDSDVELTEAATPLALAVLSIRTDPSLSSSRLRLNRKTL